MEFIGEKICEKINVGKVKIYKKNVEISEKKFIDIESVDENISKFKNLIKKYTDRLKEADTQNNLEKDIMKVYVEMVTDPYFEETVIDKISHKMLNYKFAVKDLARLSPWASWSSSQPPWRSRCSTWPTGGRPWEASEESG